MPVGTNFGSGPLPHQLQAKLDDSRWPGSPASKLRRINVLDRGYGRACRRSGDRRGQPPSFKCSAECWVWC